MVGDARQESPQVSVADLFHGVRWQVVRPDPVKGILPGYTAKIGKDNKGLIEAIEKISGAVNFIDGEDTGTAWIPEDMGLGVKDKNRVRS